MTTGSASTLNPNSLSSWGVGFSHAGLLLVDGPRRVPRELHNTIGMLQQLEKLTSRFDDFFKRWTLGSWASMSRSSPSADSAHRHLRRPIVLKHRRVRRPHASRRLRAARAGH